MSDVLILEHCHAASMHAFRECMEWLVESGGHRAFPMEDVGPGQADLINSYSNQRLPLSTRCFRQHLEVN
jgi:hypothetical protein